MNRFDFKGTKTKKEAHENVMRILKEQNEKYNKSRRPSRWGFDNDERVKAMTDEKYLKYRENERGKLRRGC